MHTIFCGVTLSGKTTLARQIARDLAYKGDNIVVYDPVGTSTRGGGWPQGAIVFDDAENFLAYIGRNDVGNAHVFIDEAADIFAHNKVGNFWMLTKGRHFGLSINVIVQRPKLISPSVRSQCGRCYMFRLARDDAKEIAADFGHNFNIQQFDLDKGEFLVLESGSRDIRKLNIANVIKESSRA